MTTNNAGAHAAERRPYWRRAQAKRAAVLIDPATYYGALRASLLKAKRSVFIAGWDIDSRTRLVGASGAADDGLPEQLGSFLTELVARRPELKIHLLLWDYSMLYALDREPLPTINLDWKTPAQISVCLDDVLPVGASHHQKIAVVDDAVAFCGGIDLTIRRWDTSAHDIDNDVRVDPAGAAYRPFHDMQMMVDGAAAQALAELVRARWQRAACERPISVAPAGDPWPDHVEADFTDVPVGIARTLPPYEGEAGVREVEALFRRSIQMAETSIYIECQYLTADGVARELVRRLQENRDLGVVIVAPNVHHSWLEERSMNAGRRRFMAYLDEAGVTDRVRLVYPAVPGDTTGEGVMVHAKAMIVDDRFLRIGSANLNNRSMGTDTECDLAVEAETPPHRETIVQTRNRLLGEHLDVAPEQVADAVARHGSLPAAVDALAGGARTLRPIDLGDTSEDEIERTISQLADPEKPIAPPTFAGDLFGGASTDGAKSRLVKLAGAAAAILVLVLLWRYTPVSALTDPHALTGWLKRLDGALWMPLVIPVVFVVGGLVAFPVTVLIAVMGMMFSPLAAFAYSFAGALLSASATFLIGAAIGRRPLRDWAGVKVNRLSRALARKGVVSVTAVRMVPIAPFTLINLVAGASEIRFADFLLGTVLGMAPGILVMSFLGHQLGRTLSNPSPAQLGLFVLGMAVWLLLSLGLQYAAGKLRSARHD